MGYCHCECGRREPRLTPGRVNDGPDCAPDCAMVDGPWNSRPDFSAAPDLRNHAVNLSFLRQRERSCPSEISRAELWLCSCAKQRTQAAISCGGSEPRERKAAPV